MLGLFFLKVMSHFVPLWASHVLPFYSNVCMKKNVISFFYLFLSVQNEYKISGIFQYE